MEAAIATKMKFDLYLPTRAYFLEHFLLVSEANPKQRHLAHVRAFVCSFELNTLLQIL